MTLKQTALLLLGVSLSSTIWLLIDRLWLWDNVISVVWAFVSLAAGPMALFVYAIERWSARFPARPHGHQTAPHPTAPGQPTPPQPAPVVINVPPEPSPVQSQTPPPPAVPQRPVQPGDFAEPQGSIFDGQRRDAFTDLFGTYHAPNQPNPWDTETAMPPLEPFDDSGKPSPWDDIPVTFDSPLHTGPLLPRRAPTRGEIDTIRDIYAETGSLNATVRRVYGSKDAKTHGWIKATLDE